jgi:hypothetical protein
MSRVVSAALSPPKYTNAAADKAVLILSSALTLAQSGSAATTGRAKHKPPIVRCDEATAGCDMGAEVQVQVPSEGGADTRRDRVPSLDLQPQPVPPQLISPGDAPHDMLSCDGTAVVAMMEAAELAAVAEAVAVAVAAATEQTVAREMLKVEGNAGKSGRRSANAVASEGSAHTKSS